MEEEEEDEGGGRRLIKRLLRRPVQTAWRGGERARRGGSSSGNICKLSVGRPDTPFHSLLVPSAFGRVKNVVITYATSCSTFGNWQQTPTTESAPVTHRHRALTPPSPHPHTHMDEMRTELILSRAAIIPGIFEKWKLSIGIYRNEHETTGDFQN